MRNLWNFKFNDTSISFSNIMEVCAYLELYLEKKCSEELEFLQCDGLKFVPIKLAKNSYKFSGLDSVLDKYKKLEIQERNNGHLSNSITYHKLRRELEKATEIIENNEDDFLAFQYGFTVANKYNAIYSPNCIRITLYNTPLRDEYPFYDFILTDFINKTGMKFEFHNGKFIINNISKERMVSFIKGLLFEMKMGGNNNDRFRTFI